MSRIGNKPITVPENVEVKIDGHHIEAFNNYDSDAGAFK